METMQAIGERRAVREYQAKPVDEATIRRLIDAAILAPSAINAQPWTFTVVRNESLLNRLSHDAKSHLLSASPGAQPREMEQRLHNDDFHIFYHAPALVVVSAVNNDPWTVEDCAMAAENLMLAARDLGLGSCWIGLARSYLQTPAAKAALGIPASWIPVAPLIVGYPAENPPATSRKPAEIIWVN